MADDPDVIRKQMEETRTDLTAKLETLEQEVAKKVENATEKVSETVENVTETVRDTADTVKETVHETIETVKSTFDLPHHVDQHPWLMFGGAVAVGYVGGCLLSKLEEPRSVDRPERMQTDNGCVTADGKPEASSRPHWLDGTIEMFRPEIDGLKKLAISAAMSVARDLLTASLSEAARQPVAKVMDNVTTKLGGKPMHGSMGSKGQEQDSKQGYAATGAFEG